MADLENKRRRKLEQMLFYEVIEIDDELLFQCEWGYYSIKKKQTPQQNSTSEND